MPQQDHEQKAFYDIWHILLRYRWRFVLPGFLAAAVVLVASLQLPRKYKADATFERTTNMVIRQMHRGGATQAYEDPARALTRQIVSETAINTVLTKLGPALKKMGVVKNDLDLHQLHSRIRRQTTLHREIDSWQLKRTRLEYIGRDPRVAKMVVNGLIQLYIDQNKKRMKDRLNQSSSFFKTQMEMSKKKADALQSKLLNFEIEHANLLPDSPNNIQNQIATLTDQIQQLQAERNGLTSEITSLKASLANEPKMVSQQVPMQNSDLHQLKTKRSNLEDKLSNDLQVKKMRPTHPDVIDLKNRIAALDQRIKKATDSPEMITHMVANPKLDATEARLDLAKADRKALDNQLAAMNNDLARKTAKASSLYPIRSTYENLKRQSAEAQHQINFWRDNLRNILLSSTAENDNRGISVRFVSHAKLNRIPVSPQLSQVVIAALLIGLLVGSICVFLAYRSDDTFLRGDAAAKAIGLPLLGIVSEVVTRRYRYFRMIRHAILYPAYALIIVTVLTGLMGVVYLNLQRPALYAALRFHMTSLLHLPISGA